MSLYSSFFIVRRQSFLMMITHVAVLFQRLTPARFPDDLTNVVAVVPTQLYYRRVIEKLSFHVSGVSDLHDCEHSVPTVPETHQLHHPTTPSTPFLALYAPNSVNTPHYPTF